MATRAGQLTVLWPVLCLVGVAIHQFCRVHASGLSPWRGGAFGMFAVVDNPIRRTLVAYCPGEDSNSCVIDLSRDWDRLPDDLQGYAGVARSRPTTDALRRLADAIRHAVVVPSGFYSRSVMQRIKATDKSAGHPWAERDTARTGLYTILNGDSVPHGDRLAIGVLRVEVRRMTFEAHSDEVGVEIITGLIAPKRGQWTGGPALGN